MESERRNAGKRHGAAEANSPREEENRAAWLPVVKYQALAKRRNVKYVSASQVAECAVVQQCQAS